MTRELPPESRERILGLDVLRLISFLAIWLFHFYWSAWYRDDNPIGAVSPIFLVAHIAARTITFSGFTIIFLTSFLHGLFRAEGRRRVYLLVFLLLGWTAFSALIADDEEPFFFIWDVYPLIFTGFMSAYLVERAGRPWLRALGIFGAVLLWIPFRELSRGTDFSLFWRQIWVGACERDMGDWPILPWIGLIWGGYALGAELRTRGLRQADERLRLSLNELSAWGIALALGLPQWGPYFNARSGPGFSCDTYGQPPLVFWSHFVWPLFVMRISFDPRVQAWLQSWRLTRWIGTLTLSRHFWLVYFLAYVFEMIVTADQGEYFLAHPRVAELALLAGLPIVEHIARLIMKGRAAWTARRNARPSGS